MYAKDISKKVRSARKVSAQQGKFMGSKPPYGYVKSTEDKHLLVIDPVAAVIVKRIFTEFAGGESGRNIAAKLNAENVDTPADYYFKQTGKRATRSDKCQQWGSATIIQLLKNQVYIGNMVQNKRKASSFKTKKRLVTSPEEWIIVEDTHEAIIDGYTWDCVQKHISAVKKAPSNHIIKTNSTDEVSIFSGIIRCADCGAAMTFNRRVRKSGKEKLVYRCSRYNNNGKDTCSTHTIDVDVLKDIILKDIQHHAAAAINDEQQMVNRLLSYSGQEQEKEKSAQEQTLRDIKNRIAFVEDASKKLFEERVRGNVPDSIFKKLLADYERELSALEAKHAETTCRAQDATDSEQGVMAWLRLIKECAAIDELDRATAYQLIDHISVHERIEQDGQIIQDVHVKYNFVGRIAS